jgi:hypothetical protein
MEVSISLAIGDTKEHNLGMDRSPKGIAIKKDRYIVDVCYGGVYALFPDSTVRAFKTMDEAETAIRQDCKRRIDKKSIHVAVIEWNARDKEVEETIEWRTKTKEN